jgi:acetyl/propionyl-CoA carboxylase alpha subunit
VRVDDGIESDTAVTPYYDPMLAKVITWGRTRPEAIAKMRRALGDMVALGVTTNIPYLLAILAEPEFVAGRTSTSYLAERMAGWPPQTELTEAEWLAVAAMEALHGGGKQARPLAAEGDGETAVDPWTAVTAFRNV